MKKNHLKSFCARCLTLLILALLSTNLAWGADVTIIFASGTNSEGNYYFQANNGTIANVVSFSSAKNGSSNDPAYNGNSSELRLYYNSGGNGGSITLTAVTGITITGFELTTSTAPTTKYKADNGTATTITYTNNVASVTSLSCSSLVIQNCNTSNTQLKIKKIKITYNGGKTLKSLIVSGEPSKKTYEAGQSFDPTGLTVLGTYDGQDEPEQVTSGIEWTISPDPLEVNTKSVTVTAQVGNVKSNDYVVNGLTVIAALPKITITKTSSGITGSSYSSSTFTQNKVTFAYKDWMPSTDFIQAKASTSPSLQNTTAMPGKITKIQVVTGSGKTARAVTIKAGTTSTVADMVSITSPTTSMDMTFDFGKNNYTYFCLSTPGNACYFDKIVVFYEEAKPLDHITVTGTPKDFFVGDEFNHDGMTVTAYYEGDDNGEDVTAWATFSTPDMTSAGEKDVTVTYGDKEASYKINVQAVVLTSVVVSGTPTKRDYFVGESFNPAGLTVTGHYNNGTQATITEGISWTITPETFTETTQNSVSVTATVGNITSDAFEVTGLTVTSPASAYTLTAEPAEGGSYTVTVGGDPAVEVTAEAKQFMVTEGTVIVVEATANEHYKVHSTPFEGKYADETPITFDNTGVAKKKQFTYGTADATITAKFLQMYAVNIDVNIEHGTVVADPVENTPTSVITLTLTPATHYHFESVTVKDKNGGDIALEGEPTTTEEGITTAKFKMPAAEDTKGDVSVTATFAEDTKYTVTFSVNGENTTSDANYAGEPVEFPEVSNVGDYTFMGWTTEAINGTQDNAPTFVNKETAVYPTNNNTLYYAVFAEKSGSENYVKVTSINDGKYLIVNEALSRAFNGKDEANGYVTVSISNGEIADPNGAAIVEIKSMTGGYSLEITNGENANKFIYGKSGSNTIEYGTTAVANEITISDGAATILSNSTSFRYNSASGNDRFRYYKTSTTGNAYTLPALYKKQEATYSDYCTTITSTNIVISEAGWATVCLPFKATITSGNATAHYVTGTNDAALVKTEAKVIPAGEGVLLKSNDGGEATVTFTISDEDADPATDNMMKGAITETTFNESGYKYYILANGGNGLGFYYQGAGNTTGASVKCAAGKAILAVPTTSSAKAFFSLDNEPTGITSYENDNDNENLKAMTVYNLNGVRVNPSTGSGQAYKGIVIMNGKKYINK